MAIFRLDTVLSARRERLWSYKVWKIFDVSQGLLPDLWNYLCIDETSMALHEGLSSSAENKDEERTGNNYEDDLDPEGKGMMMTAIGTWIQKMTNLTMMTLHMAVIRPSLAKIPIQNYVVKRAESSILRPSIIFWSFSMRFILVSVRRPTFLGSLAPRC